MRTIKLRSLLLKNNFMAFIKSDDILPGDLLRVKRKAGYYHFGIALDKNHVIHFSGTNDDSISNYKDVKIRKAPLSLFVHGDDLEVNSPFDSLFSREEIIARASEYLNSDLFNGMHYNLMNNNCEHFARYCYYGKSTSKQVKTAVSIAAGAAALISSSIAIGISKGKKKEVIFNDESKK